VGREFGRVTKLRRQILGDDGGEELPPSGGAGDGDGDGGGCGGGEGDEVTLLRVVSRIRWMSCGSYVEYSACSQTLRSLGGRVPIHVSST
jgi:hypothetical protein